MNRPLNTSSVKTTSTEQAPTTIPLTVIMNTPIIRHSTTRLLRQQLYRFIHSGNSKSNSKSGPFAFAFAFDIDGVLLQGSRVLPEAKRALRILGGHNSQKTKIPFILITNGGGKSEEERCQTLSTQLGVKIDPFQLIQAHTILRELPGSDKYPGYSGVERRRPHPHDPVLVLGGAKDNVPKIAEGYGFRDVYIPADILAWDPNISPLHTLSDEDRHYTKEVDFSKIHFGSIMVFHDPRNWSLDIQIMLDILQSRDRSPGGAPRAAGDDDCKFKPVELIFCNPDVLWRGAFPQPRLGQGSFVQAFQAVYKSVTGEYYPCIQYGKPLKATFEYAESHLMKYVGGAFPHISVSVSERPRIYMIGDNPASDIAGANSVNWTSILVHTGVYDANAGRPPAHRPTHEAANVEEAVKWAMQQEGYLF